MRGRAGGSGRVRPLLGDPKPLAMGFFLLGFKAHRPAGQAGAPPLADPRTWLRVRGLNTRPTRHRGCCRGITASPKSPRWEEPSRTPPALPGPPSPSPTPRIMGAALTLRVLALPTAQQILGWGRRLHPTASPLQEPLQAPIPQPRTPSPAPAPSSGPGAWPHRPPGCRDKGGTSEGCPRCPGGGPTPQPPPGD